MNRSRLVQRASILNMRDLGGLPVSSGGWLRRGLIFRSGSPVLISPADASWLRQELGLRTFLDLRSEREVARDGRPESLIAAGIDWWHCPVEEQEDVRRAVRHARRPTSAVYADSYLAMLPVINPVVRQVLRALATGELLPLAFGCTMGKDRTGVLAALVLAALDVPEREIAADYALTGRCLRPHLASFAVHRRSKGLTALEYSGRLEARRETLMAFFALARAAHGSLAGIHPSGTLSADTVQAARDRLHVRESGSRRPPDAAERATREPHPTPPPLGGACRSRRANDRY